ncbi:hypothetical protein L198_05630 [Cryptococcus wingfieldii CBS 7118]|uniref:Uncharacterized protein n=1 Tax=Cryptococcus wingfieldii CBS 7118 TaxID=1295528 RepID=A0A1E3IW38_9TREE|nr:hypothetical protein L198_05630 [Cryptococcus wingfieldii CBS 7118]ODN92834.1 hypothetical protein L198_05630 [Cryptococcus wingfieldii CBS 7118]
MDSFFSSLPRPTSLYVSNDPRSISLLDTSSYSPFPTFPGSQKTADPYNLNNFLLHPADKLWDYVDPIPDPQAHAGSGSGSDSEGEEPEAGTGPKRAVRKQKSLGVLKPSPLSQPPIAALEVDEPVYEKAALVRKRSKSLGGNDLIASKAKDEFVESLREAPQVKEEKPKKKGIKRAFTLGKKGRTSEPVVIPPVPPVPSLSFPDALPPPISLTTRSPSSNSTLSSASSTSSSEGIKTPAEGQAMGAMIEGEQLANALEKGKKKGRMWGWFGGKKKGELSSSSSSARTTPNSSTTDLLSMPSSSPQNSQSSSPIQLPSEQFAIEHTYLTNQLRSSSMRKITQLKAPSPHPFALALVRGNRKLPDEVAMSIQNGKRVFPKSVNAWTGSGGLSPAQGGLRLGLAVRDVMIKLDRGEQPQGTIMARRPSKKSLVPRPRGVLDFINRPPFEQRNLVFLPSAICTHVSMARPGYGVWELDFSRYILGLSEVDEGSSISGSPRVSQVPGIGAGEREAKEVKATEEEVNRREEMEGVEAALKALTANEGKNSPPLTSNPLLVGSEAPLPVPAAASTRPFSSIRPNAARSNTQSSEEHEDDLPLSRRRSQHFLKAQSAVSSGNVRGRTQSQPHHYASASRFSQVPTASRSPDEALREVQAARERREGNTKGENERRAEMDRVREDRKVKDRQSKVLSRGFSMTDVKSVDGGEKRRSQMTGLGIGTALQHKRSSSSSNMLDLHRTSPPRPNHEKRTSTLSFYSQASSSSHQPPAFPNYHAKRPPNHRAKTAGDSPSSTSTQKYHSFYEQRAASSSLPTVNRLPPASSQVPMMPVPMHGQQFVYHQAYPQMGGQVSMVYGPGQGMGMSLGQALGVPVGNKRMSRMS